VAKQEQELQEKEEETAGKLAHERSKLESYIVDLSARKAPWQWNRSTYRRRIRTSATASSPSPHKKASWSVAPSR
jgi:hypothetical protein